MTEAGTLIDIASWILIIAGLFFTITGTIGLVRLPDVFARMHGAGMVDTMGMALILVGLLLHAPSAIIAIKIILILAFVFFTSPTTCYALARAALHAGVKPMTSDASTNTTDSQKTESKQSKT
ncbi:MAG: monovalent cation/H(+) antiporter subunit G [Rhodospirillaceae bacterium]|nr:monovalent cation/H(+) antiporter subunit G [Rhodospirillaceae bacterium]